MKRSRKALSAAERATRIERAMAFDMHDIVQRYIQESGVSEDVAREHERELKRFLVVCALNDSGKPIGMAGPVDKLWHTFVLFTRQYAAFCQQVAGRFLHHVPAVPGAGRTVTGGYARFRTSYTDIFGADPPSSSWPAAGAAATTSAGPCLDCFDCFGPDPVPCDNREPDDCAGTDTEDDDDSDTDDDEDRDDDSETERP